VLKGSFTKGQLNGYGSMECGPVSYTGFFKGSIYHGRGKFKNSNTGEYYNGSYYLDVFHGKGEHILPNGEKYDGTFDQGQRHGTGTWYKNPEDQNASIYRGDWLLGLYHGTGILEYNRLSFYKGEF